MDWKESVQRYSVNILSNIYKTQKEIRAGTYQSKPMVEFELHERGRIRCIKSQHISDRVVQRSLNDNVLIPRIKTKLIYDNGASLKKKGTDFARRRFRVHLQRAYREYGDKGYILFIDFSKYFDNILHDKALEQLRPFLSEAEFGFVKKCFRAFEVDVSNLTDEEYADCYNVLFNALEYQKQTKGERFMRKSVGIGEQISQVTGILYPHPADNYCKIVKGLKYYGRFMDDSYIMLDSKERLLAIYQELLVIYKELGIFVNPKKVRIVKITAWNCFLKVNHKVLPSGKIIRKITNDTIRRERKRLRVFKRLHDGGRMTKDEILLCYKGWRGSYEIYHSGNKLRKLDKLFEELFQVKVR